MSVSAALLQGVESPRITGVQFGLLNPDKVRRQSVVAITESTLYTRNLPTSGGLNDLRMGTCDRRLFCGTCRYDISKCPGHFGSMDLALPMYHVSMIPIVLKMIRCVCVWCSALLVGISDADPRIRELSGRARLAFICNLTKSRRKCPKCKAPQPKYVHTRVTATITRVTAGVVFEDAREKEAMERPFTAGCARKILAGISDADVRVMGSDPTYSRPEWMVLTVLQIPPPISRPCITASDGSRTRGQDDVTTKLLEILKANKAVDTVLRDLGCASGFMPDPDVTRVWCMTNAASITMVELLQQHLVQFFHHGGQGADVRGASNRAHARNMRLIPDRWKGKKGRFRGNLGGKRVDFSSRTVASPAPDYDVDEVGIPSVVAYHLTFPERVTPFNKDMLTRCVRLGVGVKDGAASIIIPGGDPIDLGLCTDRGSIELEIGWVVERHLIEGDWVLLNRQPSLHRMSIMAHRIRIIPDKTFRLPVCDTTPYNADFDGDELNVHVLQTHDARAEARELMSAGTQMINPENNRPIIALVQDSLVSAFMLSDRNTMVRKDQVMQMMMNLRYLPGGLVLPPPAIIKPVQLWTGKQVFSMLFPGHLTFDMAVRGGGDDGVQRPGGWMDPDERRVIVRHGQLVCGTLCKKTLGTSAGGIVHVLIRDWGLATASNFVSDAQRLLQAYTMIRGFSVGIADCVMGKSTHDRVNALMTDLLKTTDRIHGESQAPEKLVDGCVTKMLGGFLTSSGSEVIKDVNVSSGNRIAVMVESGAKGSDINISQILGCVGQQNVEGGRIRLGVEGRTLPCFKHGDVSAGARGFVCNSYGTGVTAQEYFFHAMGGREGLVDTAVKTASTGYIQRRLSKAQEGLQVRYDSTVRNSSGDVIQFYYGGDSYYPTKLERVRYAAFNMDDAELRAYVVGSDVEWKMCAEGCLSVARAQVATLRADRDSVRSCQMKLSQKADGEMVMPTNPWRVFTRAVSKFGHAKSPVDPVEVVACVDRVLGHVRASLREDATRFTVAYIRSYLTLRNFVVVHRLGMDGVRWVCSTIQSQFQEALAESGEMVGTLGASSIGAPCTQMTLNTFHTAGVLAHTVTQGVPRLKELIDMSAHIRTPSVHIAFESRYASSEPMARALSAGIEHTFLSEIVKHSEVLECAVSVPTTGPDAAMVKMHALLSDPSLPSGGDCLIRFELDRATMCRKRLSVHDAGHGIQAYLGRNGVVVHSEVNMVDWCVRVRLVDVKDTSLKYMYLVHDFLLDNVPVHGVPGIRRVIPRSDTVRVADPVTGGLVDTKVWSADTEGTNLLQMLSLPGVDAVGTYSNDIHETLSVLGIEAAAHQLLTEIRSVLSHDGAYVNDRHLQLLVDVMTQCGDLAPVTRHSMSKMGASVYTRASFEQTQEVLTWAAAMGTHNTTNGVTENIMIGNTISGGTGACDVITVKGALPKPYVPKVVQPLEFSSGGGVLPLNPTVVSGVLVCPLNRTSPAGFIGKKRKAAGGSRVMKTARSLLLHSPGTRNGPRSFAPHSPSLESSV